MKRGSRARLVVLASTCPGLEGRNTIQVVNWVTLEIDQFIRVVHERFVSVGLPLVTRQLSVQHPFHCVEVESGRFALVSIVLNRSVHLREDVLRDHSLESFRRSRSISEIHG